MALELAVGDRQAKMVAPREIMAEIFMADGLTRKRTEQGCGAKNQSFSPIRSMQFRHMDPLIGGTKSCSPQKMGWSN